MRSLPVFAAEREAGLADLLSKSVATITAPVRVPVETDPGFDKFIAKLQAIASSANLDGVDQPDLAYIVSILASTGWNRNDDIFTPDELWAAKDTPVHKPINVGHDQTDIVGHMVQARALDKSANEIVLADGAAIPTDFDVEVAGVLYKELPPLAEKIAGIIAAAKAGELFVSMECFFSAFDYGFKDPATAAVKIIVRSEQTAFLTKHLRIYGGKGEYQGYQVGRVLRDILFIGKGIVTRPANPDSVIKQVATVAASAFETTQLTDLKGGAEGMANENTKTTETPAQVDETTKAIETAKAEAKAATEALEALKAQKLDEQVAALTTKVTEVQTTVATLTTENAGLKARLDEATKRAQDAEAELASIRKAEKARARLAEMSKVRKIEDEKATLAELAEMTDETFALVLRYAGSAKSETINPNEKPQAETSAQTGTVAPVAEKPTPKPEEQVTEEATAALDTASEEDEADMQGGTATASESLMAVASATALRLLGRETKN